MFETFDFDGSGALDAMELTALYNDNGVKVTEEEIKEMYSDEGVLFTLDMFEKMYQDPIKLRAYRQVLKKLKYRLEA